MDNARTSLPAGTYTVTITNDDCTTSTTFIIGNVGGPAAIMPSVTAATCDAADGSADFGATIPEITITWEDGKEYPLVKVEISSDSHPFYTGKMKFVDTAGRIDKFNKKFAKFAKTSKVKMDTE